jgi:GntR family transcriptional regulator, transcriptional repressor for pyruvate dehydrogenase complex
MAPRIQRSLVSDQVFRALCEDILCGTYAPGEKLPTQRALAADLGVNMASIREAIKRLEQLRLVEVRHGDAMRVRDWHADGGLDLIAHLLLRAGGVDAEILASVLESRRLMLTEAARLAAGRRSDAQAERLRELAGRLASAPDTAAAQAIDWELMAVLVEASGNLVLRLIMNSIRALYLEHAAAFEAVVGDLGALAPLYDEATRAVLDADGDRAARAVETLAGLQEQALLAALASMSSHSGEDAR